jgi:hypothetical protein
MGVKVDIFLRVKEPVITDLIHAVTCCLSSLKTNPKVLFLPELLPEK